MSDSIPQASASTDEHRDAMPVAEALDLAARIADPDNAFCEALLYRRGAEVCDVLRHEVLRLVARAADTLVDAAWWRGLNGAVESLTAQRDAAVARAETAEREVARLTRERDAR